jgi:tRNA (guanine37-N1)-methyltransferase
MKIDILTLFPTMFEGPFGTSIIKRSIDKGVVEIDVHDLRKWSVDKYKTVDDKPYGGGPGMIIKVDLIDRALNDIKKPNCRSMVLLTDAGGDKFDNSMANELSAVEQIIVICGHYEGIDHRVHEHLADKVVSVGEFVMSGGEIPAMAITDAVVRLLPGSLGNPESLSEESFTLPGKEYPQYTRPEEYKGWRVPDVLLSGNHKLIEQWRKIPK